jgi:hypothetical protein
MLAVVCVGAQQKSDGATPADVFGIWPGSWEGMGSTGGFELTLEKGADGATGGRVVVTGEPAYKATLKTVSFEGRKMAATYDFTPDTQLEIRLSITFDKDTAKGSWSARAKESGSELASGTLTFAKK